jgi:hypothetical protein
VPDLLDGSYRVGGLDTAVLVKMNQDIALQRRSIARRPVATGSRCSGANLDCSAIDKQGAGEATMDTFHDQLMLDSAVLPQAGSGRMRMREPMNWHCADVLPRDRLITPQGSSDVRVSHVHG